jgi:hypothetical protein
MALSRAPFVVGQVNSDDAAPIMRCTSGRSLIRRHMLPRNATANSQFTMVNFHLMNAVSMYGERDAAEDQREAPR